MGEPSGKSTGDRLTCEVNRRPVDLRSQPASAGWRKTSAIFRASASGVMGFWSKTSSGIGVAGLCDGRSDRGKKAADRSPPSGRPPAGDPPAVLLDDSVHRRQPESASLPARLGREERLEGALPRLLVHAKSRVADLEQHVRAGGRGRMHRNELGVQRDVACRDAQPAAGRHGISRIDREVDDDLLDLSRVGHDEVELRVERDDELDVLADQTPEHVAHAGDGGVEIEWLPGGRLIAAEREELSRQARGALGGALDLVEALAHRVLGLVTGERELAQADDYGEHIVEVVRDATRKAPDRLDLLELAHLALALTQDLFGPLTLRDVPAHAGETAHLAVLIRERRARPLVGDEDAVGATQSALDLERLVPEARGGRRPARIAIVLGGQIDQWWALEVPRAAPGHALGLP